MSEPPLIELGDVVATADELERHPTKKFKVRRGDREVEAFVVSFSF